MMDTTDWTIGIAVGEAVRTGNWSKVRQLIAKLPTQCPQPTQDCKRN